MNQGTYKHLSDGRIFDETRGLLICIDKSKSHPQNRIQRHITYVKMDQLNGLTDQEMDYLITQTRQHLNKQPHGHNEDENSPIITKNRERYKHRQHIKQLIQCLRYDFSIEHGERYTEFNTWLRHKNYNQWYMLGKPA
jgi:hypothetical protein